MKIYKNPIQRTDQPSLVRFIRNNFIFNPLNYDETRDLSLWNKICILLGPKKYKVNSQIDGVLEYIINNRFNIQKILTTKTHVDVYFKNGEVALIWNEDKWSRWCGILKIYYTDEETRELKNAATFYDCIPSRRMMLKFARFLCHCGIRF